LFDGQANVLIDGFGIPRLADPCLSKVIGSMVITPGIGNVNVRWMPPELLSDTPSAASYSSDVYAFTMTCLVWFFSSYEVNYFDLFIQEVYSGDVPYADVQDLLVVAKVFQGHKPSCPDNVNNLLWDLWCLGWSSDKKNRPDMKSIMWQLEAFS
jgi:serine/threonine protein kinase